MTIPDAAIEAAAEAIADTIYGLALGDLDASEYTDAYMGARAALEAAMPAIREALAQKIETSPTPVLTRHDALRIVRGGTP